MIYNYPRLSETEQAGLPPLIAKPELLAAKFEDSTHKLWLCNTTDGQMVLKLCQHQLIAQSSFWKGMNHLFAADFPAQLAQTRHTHQLLNQNGAMVLPDIVDVVNNRFLLSEFISGQDVDANAVTSEAVTLLAKHIASLHQQSFSKWGSISSPQFKTGEWGERLQATLKILAIQSTIEVPDSQLEQLLGVAETIEEADFVPIMPDLRWDQFRLIEQQQALALIDLDAFVIGPAALELVLLEYVLTPPQFAWFKDVYIETHDWPDYQLQKPCYQLLLFLMNVLGETDIDKWM